LSGHRAGHCPSGAAALQFSGSSLTAQAPAGQAPGAGRGRGGRGADGAQPLPGQERGALIRRPGADREPTVPPPTITQYKPKSTLIVPQHPVPRAKYPVIDIHSHQPAPITAEQFDALAASMEPLNLKVLVNSSASREIGSCRR
jgi:hypothetical protein